MQIVTLHAGEPVTTTVALADGTKTQHKNVLDDSDIALSRLAYLSETYVHQHGEFGAAALLLGVVLKCEEETGDPWEAHDLLLSLKAIDAFPDCLLMVVSAVELELFNAMRVTKGGNAAPERALQNRFFADLDDYLPGAVKTEVKRLPGSTPDGFVHIDGITAPVEVKADLFGERALAQLLGYMRRYQMPRGIAVAQRCTADLPPEVTFVAVLPALSAPSTTEQGA